MNSTLNSEEQQELRRFLNHPESVIGCALQGNDSRRNLLKGLQEKGFITLVNQKPKMEYYQLNLEA